METKAALVGGVGSPVPEADMGGARQSSCASISQNLGDPASVSGSEVVIGSLRGWFNLVAVALFLCFLLLCVFFVSST